MAFRFDQAAVTIGKIVGRRPECGQPAEVTSARCQEVLPCARRWLIDLAELRPRRTRVHGARPNHTGWSPAEEKNLVARGRSQSTPFPMALVEG